MGKKGAGINLIFRKCFFAQCIFAQKANWKLL